MQLPQILNYKFKELNTKLRDKKLYEYDSSDLEIAIQHLRRHRSTNLIRNRDSESPKVDDCFGIDKKIGNKLMVDFKNKFGVDKDTVNP